MTRRKPTLDNKRIAPLVREASRKPVAVNTVRKQLAPMPSPPPTPDEKAAAYLSKNMSSADSHKVLKIEDDGTPAATQLARSFLSPVSLGAITAENFHDNKNLDITAAVKLVRERAEAVVKGDLSEMETTLVANVAALDAIFCTLAVYANQYLKAGKFSQFDMLMRTALKAQSQVRCTVDSIAEIKNPRPVYARNVNVANGPQQVNTTTGPQQINNRPTEEAPRAENQGKPSSNKVLAAS